MKIRTHNLQSYNTSDVSELVGDCKKIGDLSYQLMEEGVKLAGRFVEASEMIDTVNFTAAKDNMITYLQISKHCYYEMEELAISAVEYGNVLAMKWNFDGFAYSQHGNVSFDSSALAGGTTNNNHGFVKNVEYLNLLISYVNIIHSTLNIYIQMIKQVKASLANVWKDPQYNEFAECVTELTQKMSQNMENIDACVKGIKREIGQ